MKRKHLGRTIAGFLALAFTLTACSPAEPIQEDAGSSAAPVSAPETSRSGGEEPSGERVKLTYYCGSLGNTIIQSYNDNVMYQKVQEILNIQVDFQHSAADQFREQLGVMIASRDLPDMVEGFTYNKGPDAAIDEGLILRLNDLAEQYAPDYMALLNSDPELKRQCVTDEGTIWSLNCLEPQGEMPWRGFSIRRDLLEKCGVAMPETLGELETALKSLKDNGVLYPMSISIKNNTTYSGDSLIVAAFEVGANWYKDLQTGEIKYGPMQDGFLDFLTMMNRWYQEGLIDPEFNTRTGDDRNTMIVNGDIALFESGYGPSLNNQRNGEAQNPEFQLDQLPNLPLNKGEKVQSRNWDPMNKGNETIISTNCKNPETAMKFLNFGYTEEGTMLYNYGVEGISYTMVDGRPEWTELITNGEEGSWVTIRDKYKKHTGPYNRDAMAFPVTDYEQHCMEVWNRAGTGLMMPQRLILTAEENEIFTPLMTDVNVYLDESLTQFINGTLPLSKFDDFRKELTNMKIDQALEIQKAAYTRYMNRSK